MPQADLEALRGLVGAALAIAALAAIESLLRPGSRRRWRRPGRITRTGNWSVRAWHRWHPGVRRNAGDGAIARTAVNVRSGARTRVAAITHSVLLLGVVYLATGPVSAIPLSALAGVLMVTSFRMISARTVRKILRSTRSDAAIFVLTAVVTVCSDLIEAVEIGIAVACVLRVAHGGARSSVVRQQLPGPPQAGDERIALLQLDGAMFFGAAERISNAITDAEHPEVSVVIIGCHNSACSMPPAPAPSPRSPGNLRRAVSPSSSRRPTRAHGTAGQYGYLRRPRHENHPIDSLDDAVATRVRMQRFRPRSSPSAR